MKFNSVRIITVLVFSCLLINCGGNKAVKPTQETSNTSLPTPTKEIIVTDGDINKKYTILGQIDYTPEKGSSVYANRFEANKQAKEELKKAAFAKYGEKVDAIINAKEIASLKGGFWGAVGAAYGAKIVASSIGGLAVSFDEAQGGATVESKKSLESEGAGSSKKSSLKSKKKSRK